MIHASVDLGFRVNSGGEKHNRCHILSGGENIRYVLEMLIESPTCRCVLMMRLEDGRASRLLPEQHQGNTLHISQQLGRLCPGNDRTGRLPPTLRFLIDTVQEAILEAELENLLNL